MRFLAVLALSLLVFTLPSHAAPPACNAGAEGTIVYNKDAKLVQFCNGTDWIGMVAKIGGTGDTLGDLSCSNDEVPTWDGSAWVCGAGGGGLWADSGNGYLTYTGTDVGIKIQSVTGMAAPTNTLVDLGCANDEILKWDGDSWECAADDAGSLADNAVTNAKMADDAIGIAELSATGTPSATTYLRGDNTWATISSGLPSLTSANIWVGNGSNAATAVTMSGDATLSNAGVLTIGSNAIGSAEITNASIALADLSATGTASATTYLRGDNTWATVPSGADNLGDHIATTVLRSDTHNTDDLGTTAIRWKDGWFAGTVTGGTFAGSGASLTALNATNLASGTVAAARMPALTGDVTMTAGTTVTNIAANAVGSAEIQDGSITAADTAVIGTLTEAKWCTVSGGKIVCTSNEPSGGGGSANYQYFASSGTWNKPGTGSLVFIECWGGGGGGGRNSGTVGGAGGGGGAYAAKWIPLSELPSSVSVTVGVGGAGATANPGSGSGGGNSSFGSYVVAGGGNPGVSGTAGAGGAPTGGIYEALTAFHGGTGGINSAVGFSSVYGGGGGGGRSSAGGQSSAGGSGGLGGNSTAGDDGEIPGGGGGGGRSAAAGSGARGECNVTVF